MVSYEREKMFPRDWRFHWQARESHVMDISDISCVIQDLRYVQTVASAHTLHIRMVDAEAERSSRISKTTKQKIGTPTDSSKVNIIFHIELKI